MVPFPELQEYEVVVKGRAQWQGMMIKTSPRKKSLAWARVKQTKRGAAFLCLVKRRLTSGQQAGDGPTGGKGSAECGGHFCEV